MVRKMSMGEGVAFHVPSAKMKRVRVNLTPRQASVLRKGGAITIKMITPNGSHELELPEVDVKKLMTKINRGVGGRITLNGGGIVEDFGKYVQPLSDAAINRGRRELGEGLFGKMPIVDSNIAYPLGMKGRGMKRGRKGKGLFDFLDPAKNGANRFFTQTLPDTLVDEGIPIVGSVAGSTIGAATGNPLLGLAGSMAGKELGKEAARRIRRKQGRGLADLAMEVAKRAAKQVAKKVISVGAKKARQGSKYLIDRAEAMGNEFVGDGIMPANVGGGILPAGVNLRRGAGMNTPIIQTGSPYLQIGAPGWKPYVPSQNPFTTNTMVMRQPKHGGMVVRM